VVHYPEPPLIRQPARAAVLVGGVLTLVGAAMTWASGPPHDDAVFTPVVRSTGPVFVIATLIVVAFALNRAASDARIRTVQVLPGALGVVLVLAWLETWRDLGFWLTYGSSIGYHSEGPAGPVLSGFGVAIVAIAGVYLSVTAWRRNGAMRDPTDSMPDLSSVARGVIEVSGAAIGLVAGLAVAASTFNPVFAPLMMLAAIFGGAAGIWIARRIARLALPERREIDSPRTR
jgi:hypothetical protein